jgi:hypothetical protein
VRWQRLLWLVWCGFWALVWLAGAGNTLIQYEDPIAGHSPGAALDLLIELALVAGSLLLMMAPVGKRRGMPTQS